MKEGKVNSRLLYVVAGYAMINSLLALATLYFKPDIEVIVLIGSLLMVGWFNFAILQYRVACYESLKAQQKLLRSVERRGYDASVECYSIDKNIIGFERSFSLAMKVIKFLEGR